MSAVASRAAAVAAHAAAAALLCSTSICHALPVAGHPGVATSGVNESVPEGAGRGAQRRCSPPPALGESCTEGA
jgi:hypothetical protein